MASNKEIKMLRANYEHMLQSPVFAKMQRRVRSLEKERKSLRRVIVELGSKLDVGIKHVVIKTEPCEVIDLTQNESENVKYELEEESDEFKCQECSTVQGLNNCERCDKENICEECYGEGGDYGPGEIWVCHECLPTCLECEAPLYTTYDECCGKGRSDEEE